MPDRIIARAPLLAAAVVMMLTGLVLVLTPAPRGLYVIEGHLQLVTPNANGGGNAYRADAGNSTLFAAAIERAYNLTPETARVASTSATLYGMGVRDGSRVTLPSAGSQWTNSFDQPYLRVEVVSPDPSESQERFDGIVSRLTRIAQQLQDRVGVVPAAAVHLELSPVAPDIEYVGGRRTRWLMVVSLIGMICAVSAFHTVRRFSRVRPARCPAQAPSASPARAPSSLAVPDILTPVSSGTRDASDRAAVGAGPQHGGVGG